MRFYRKFGMKTNLTNGNGRKWLTNIQKFIKTTNKINFGTKKSITTNFVTFGGYFWIFLPEKCSEMVVLQRKMVMPNAICMTFWRSCRKKTSLLPPSKRFHHLLALLQNPNSVSTYPRPWYRFHWFFRAHLFHGIVVLFLIFCHEHFERAARLFLLLIEIIDDHTNE